MPVFDFKLEFNCFQWKPQNERMDDKPDQSEIIIIQNLFQLRWEKLMLVLLWDVVACNYEELTTILILNLEKDDKMRINLVICTEIG